MRGAALRTQTAEENTAECADLLKNGDKSMKKIKLTLNKSLRIQPTSAEKAAKMVTGLADAFGAAAATSHALLRYSQLYAANTIVSGILSGECDAELAGNLGDVVAQVSAKYAPSHVRTAVCLAMPPMPYVWMRWCAGCAACVGWEVDVVLVV